MDTLQVKNALEKLNVHKLYHANTVVTSLSFIKNGGLFSRQYAESNNIPQTAQKTDSNDRKCGVFNDIFFDTVDIHDRAHRPNEYGPIVFVYSVNVLDTLLDYDICITKDNPLRWCSSMDYQEKYFTNYTELLLGFSKGDFNKHITIRDISVPLSFNYLEEIIIDNPGEKYMDLLKHAKESMESSLNEIGVTVNVTVRNCRPDCGCIEKYQMSKGYTYHRFKTEL